MKKNSQVLFDGVFNLFVGKESLADKIEILNDLSIDWEERKNDKKIDKVEYQEGKQFLVYAKERIDEIG